MSAWPERLKCGALTALAGAVGFVLPWPGQALRFASHDVPLILSTPAAPPEAVVVYLDDVSHQQLRQAHGTPWDRGFHARLITNLVAQGARVIAMDILFDERSGDPAADGALAQAVAMAGDRIILAGFIDDSRPGVRRLEQPWPALRSLADDNWGVANLRLDSDEVVRRPFHDDAEWRALRSLSWRAAERFNSGRATGAEGRPVGARLRYYGPAGTLASLSYFEALDPGSRRAAELVRGRAVFVGAGSAAGYTGELQESVRTPYSRVGGMRMAKVDVHATQFLNLVRNDGLVAAEAWLDLLWVLVAGGLMGIGLAPWRSWRLLGGGLGLMVLVGTLGVMLVTRAGLVTSWTVVLAEVPVAVAVAATGSRPGGRGDGAGSRDSAPTAVGRTTEFAPAKRVLRWEVPDHELIRCIGNGSYGEVWLARSTLGAYRAVKLVQRRERAEDRPFDRELAGLERVEPLSRLHEGLVDILHVGRGLRGDGVYYVMELADDAVGQDPIRADFRPEQYVAKTLRSVLEARCEVAVDDWVRIGIDLAEALAFLHERGLVHRDLKPANIVFAGGRPKLADIGLIAPATESGSMVGTVGYIPPEGPGTPRADLYSLGIVLYELISGYDRGRFPEFPAGMTGPASANEHLRTLGLHRLVLQLAAPDPANRPPSARAVADALRRLAEDRAALE